MIRFVLPKCATPNHRSGNFGPPHLGPEFRRRDARIQGNMLPALVDRWARLPKIFFSNIRIFVILLEKNMSPKSTYQANNMSPLKHLIKLKHLHRDKTPPKRMYFSNSKKLQQNDPHASKLLTTKVLMNK